MSYGFSRPVIRIPALLGDGKGNIRPASWDLAACRTNDAFGVVVMAIMSEADVPPESMPPEDTPIVLIYNGSESPSLPEVDLDMLPPVVVAPVV